MKSRWHEREDLTAALRDVERIFVVHGLSPEDLVCLMQRQESQIKDDVVRQVCLDVGPDLGTLVRRVQDVCTTHAVGADVPWDDVERAWWKRMYTTVTLSAAHKRHLEEVAKALKDRRHDVEVYEGKDDGSSSPSDYSDSETETEEEDEGEDEEEDEDED
jgi:hypothetical protein